MKRWEEIIFALLDITEIRPTITKAEVTVGWLEDYINSRPTLLRLKDDEDRAGFKEGRDQIAVDSQGRVYIQLRNATSYARVHQGWGMNQKSVARDLTRLGFKRHLIDFTDGGKRKRTSYFISEPGFWFYPEKEDSDVTPPDTYKG